MDDLISRREAIEAVEHITSSMSVCVNTDECHGMKRMQRQAVIELTNMPSAQKTQLSAEKTQLSTEDTTFDCISRAEAIDALKRDEEYDEDIPNRADGVRDAIITIMGLPSAQPEPHYDEWCHDCKEYDHDRHCCPRWNRVIRTALEDAQPERKTGRWIDYVNSHCECPFCHSEWSYFDNDTERFDFCPKCGADMRTAKCGTKTDLCIMDEVAGRI